MGIEQEDTRSIALLNLQRRLTRNDFITTAMANDGQPAVGQLVSQQGVDRQALDLLVVDEVVVVLAIELG